MGWGWTSCKREFASEVVRQVWIGVGRVGQGARSPNLGLATGFVHSRALRVGSDEGDGHCGS